MPPIRAVKSAALFRLFHKTGPGVSGRNVPLGQTEKDRPRRRTTGQPSTAEMFTDRPKQPVSASSELRYSAPGLPSSALIAADRRSRTPTIWPISADVTVVQVMSLRLL